MSRIFAYIEKSGAKEMLLPTENEHFCAVLDGDIDNTEGLKKLCGEEIFFAGDEELLLGCLEALDEKNKTELMFNASDIISDNASFVFSPADESALYCRAGISKLFIGFTQNKTFVTNELDALIPHCEKYAVLESNQTAKLSKERALFFDKKHRKIKKTFFFFTEKRSETAAFQGAKDAFYCALSARETYFRFVKSGGICFDGFKLNSRYLNKINKIVLLGTASAKNTALVCRGLFEAYCLLDTFALDSEEFLNSKAQIDKYTLVVAISGSSGDTATLEALLKAKKSGAKTVSLTSNKYTSLALESDFIISPKRYSQSGAPFAYDFISDYLTLALFSLYLGYKMRVISELFLGVSLKMAEMLSGIIQSAVKASPAYESAAELLNNSENIYVCASGEDFSLSLVGAQIIRESTLKGALSLSITELFEMSDELLPSSAVVVLLTDKNRLKRVLKKLKAIKSRGANVIIITSQSIAQEIHGFEGIIAFNDSLPIFNPLPCISSLYNTALLAERKESEKESEKSA